MNRSFIFNYGVRVITEYYCCQFINNLLFSSTLKEKSGRNKLFNILLLRQEVSLQLETYYQRATIKSNRIYASQYFLHF